MKIVEINPWKNEIESVLWWREIGLRKILSFVQENICFCLMIRNARYNDDL